VIGRDNFTFIFFSREGGIILILILYAMKHVKMVVFTSLQTFNV
jgi:hypothetical protein